MSALAADELLALRSKLEELLALRALGARSPPAERLRALAARFPGALRELDRTPLAVLERRQGELVRALGGGSAPVWALGVSRYHGWLRVALRLRREAARAEAAGAAWLAAYTPGLPGDPPAERVRLAYPQLRAPREGRFVALALSLAAEEACMSPTAIEAALFGP